ncbi:MAG TPA: hypothetical protein VF069_05345 [Streptosporangiaceae bacterium]
MTRINHPDSILTELRELRRRLHALETAVYRGSPPPAARADDHPDPAPPDPADADAGNPE